MFTQMITMFTQYFKECQPFLLTFTTWFSKSWHRLTEPISRMLHVDIKSHINIIISHVDMISFACRGQSYAIIKMKRHTVSKLLDIKIDNDWGKLHHNPLIQKQPMYCILIDLKIMHIHKYDIWPRPSRKTLPQGHEIYNFDRFFLCHHYYIFSLSDPCPWVEKKIFREIHPRIIFHWGGGHEIYNLLSLHPTHATLQKMRFHYYWNWPPVYLFFEKFCIFWRKLQDIFCIICTFMLRNLHRANIPL